MGVHGLWRLIEPSGKTVPVETLENKVLAVDVSIWLHQAVKGFQDAKGQPLPNAHLLGIYHRVCKLLYFRVKPVFVFDGGVPVLKKQTIAKRNQQKAKNFDASTRIHKQLLSTLLKHSAVNKVLSEKAKASIEASCASFGNKEATSKGRRSSCDDEKEDLFALPPQREETSDSEEVDSPTKNWDIHSIDMESAHFRELPADVRHEILTEMKETRKQSSWGRLHELPTKSDDFAVFQLNRLRKRYQVQVSLEEAEKEMGGHSLSLVQLEQLLNDQGVITKNLEVGNRIASDENARYLLIKDVKKAMEDAKRGTSEETAASSTTKTKAELEFEDDLRRAIELSQKEGNDSSSSQKEDSSSDDNDLQRAIKLSLECQPSSSSSSQVEPPKFEESYISSSNSESGDEANNVLTSAKNYMMEYSGLTPAEIAKIIGKQVKPKQTNKTTENTKNNDLQEQVSSSTVGKDVEIMSDSDSDSSENLMEVSSQTTNQSTGLEIVIKPTDALEDDLFSDIFDDKTEGIVESSNESTNKITVALEPQENPTSKMHKNDKITSEIVANPTSERLKAEEVVESSTEAHKNDKKPTEVVANPTSVQFKFTEVESSSENKNEAAVPLKIQENATSVEFQAVEIVESSTGNRSKSTMSAETDDCFVNPTSEAEQSETMAEKLSQPSPSKSRNEVIIEKQKTVNAIREMLKSVKESESSEVSVDELKQVQKNLSQESKELRTERATKERMAGSITDQMYQEAQELLELFGVPYVIAPMEAEAQCAFLDAIGLTDGTITDDSDIWLFGGKTVYKNFFNQSKHVMEFKAENIQHCFKLTREQMVLMALLVGSDYTTGVQGIGPVTALEILAAFPTNTTELISGLADFRRWYQGKAQKGPARNALRRKLKNLVLGENFPSMQVVQAYLDPQVEGSKEAFSWAKPDVVGLIDFAKEKFGWTRTKSEEILKPVLKRLEERFAQSSILDYFQRKHKIDSGEYEKGMSKRVKKALEKIGKGCEDDEESSETDGKKQTLKKKKSEIEDKTHTVCKKQKKTEKKKSSEQEIEESTPGTSTEKQPAKKKPQTSQPKPKLEQDPDVKVLQQTRTRSRRRLAQMEEDAKEKLQEEKARKTRISSVLHTKEVIVQKELDKKNLLRSKMKAIEVFRKSKQGPGYVKKRQKQVLEPKADAELSESDSD